VTKKRKGKNKSVVGKIMATKVVHVLNVPLRNCANATLQGKRTVGMLLG
jgi:hypothetical protein